MFPRLNFFLKCTTDCKLSQNRVQFIFPCLLVTTVLSWCPISWLSLFHFLFVCLFSVQFSHSVLFHSLRPHELAARQAFLSIINSQSPSKPMSIESVMPSNHLILCCPPALNLLLLLPSIFPSIRVFSNESSLHIRWPKYWSFSFSISLSNDYSGLIFFRIDWFDLLAIQGAINSLLQNHSFKLSVLQCSAFLWPTIIAGEKKKKEEIGTTIRKSMAIWEKKKCSHFSVRHFLFLSCYFFLLHHELYFFLPEQTSKLGSFLFFIPLWPTYSHPYICHRPSL